MSYFKKVLKILLIFVGFVILTAIVGTGVLIYKLKNGSVSLNLLCKNVMNIASLKDFDLKVSDSSLKVLENAKSPIRIEFSGVSIKSKDYDVNIKKLELEYGWFSSFNKLNLIPESVMINDVKIKKTSISTNYDNYQDLDIIYQTKQFFDLKDLKTNYVKVSNLEYEHFDKDEKLVFKGSIDATSFQRVNNNVFEFKSSMYFVENSENVGIGTNILYDIENSSALVKVRFKNANPSKLRATIIGFIEPLKSLDSVTHGESVIRLSSLGDKNKKLHEHVKEADFKIYGKAGSYYLGKDIYHFDNISLNLKSNSALNKIIIEKSDIFYQNTRANIEGEITGIDRYLSNKDYKELHMTFYAKAKDLMFDNLVNYWPSEVSPETKDWIKHHMKGGNIPSADFVLVYKGNNEKVFEPERIEGVAKVSNVDVEYLEGMPKVRKTSGEVKVTLDKVDILIDSGNTFDLDVKSGFIRFQEFDKEFANADIKLFLSGSIKDALIIADSKPLGFIKRIGLNANKTAGKTDFVLNLKFPVKETLTLNDIAVNIEGNASDVGLQVNKDLSLNEGQLHFDINNDRVSLKGNARINGTSSNIETVINFSENAGFYQKHEVDIWHTDKDLEKFVKNLGVFQYLKGLMKTKLTVIYETPDKGKLEALFDLEDVAFNIGLLGLKKNISKKANMLVMGRFDKSGLVGNVDFAYKSSSAIITGKAFFDKKSRLKYVDLNQIKSYKNNAKVKITFDDKSGSVINISGKELNLSYFVSDNNKGKTENSSLRLKMEVGKVWISEHGYLSQLYLDVEKSKGKLRQIDFSAITNEEYNPKEAKFSLLKGKITGRVENVGDMLKTLYIEPAIRLGIASVEGEIDSIGKIRGKARINSFIVKETPIIGKILLAASLTGIANAISEGTEFDKASFPFTYHNGEILIDEGTISNTSLGLTLNGKMNVDSMEADVRGTVIPIFWINGILGKIPLAGIIFSGEKGGGIFGVNYEAKGKYPDNVEVKANPFSLLAPGLLRTMFKNMSNFEEAK